MAGGEDHTASNRDTYDRIAARYTARQAPLTAGDDHYFPDVDRAFVAHLPPRAVVADLGCGPALDGRRLAEHGFDVVGMDLSHGMLREARRALPGLVAQADLRALPLADEALDGIWCAASLLHVPEDDTSGVLEQMARVLRPSGLLALATAAGDGARFEDVGYVPGERRWFVYRSAERLTGQLRAAGFDVELARTVPSHREWFTVLARLARPAR